MFAIQRHPRRVTAIALLLVLGPLGQAEARRSAGHWKGLSRLVRRVLRRPPAQAPSVHFVRGGFGNVVPGATPSAGPRAPNPPGDRSVFIGGTATHNTIIVTSGQHIAPAHPELGPISGGTLAGIGGGRVTIPDAVTGRARQHPGDLVGQVIDTGTGNVIGRY